MKRKQPTFTAQELRAKSKRDAASPLFPQTNPARKGCSSVSLSVKRQGELGAKNGQSKNRKMFYGHKPSK
jgi:hypothetical protein